MKARKGQRKLRFSKDGSAQLQDAYVDDRQLTGCAIMLRTVSMEDMVQMIAKAPDCHGVPTYIAADDKGYAWLYPLPAATSTIRVRYITYHEV